MEREQNGSVVQDNLLMFKRREKSTTRSKDDSELGTMFTPEGWADPGGTVIPGQTVARTEQAPIPWPRLHK